LGLVVAECTDAAFEERVLTFESRLQWVDLSRCATVVDDKVRNVSRFSKCAASESVSLQ
jgi:hypothetical protein